ncbi:hypothetical protein [Plantibacter flavus]|uniref:hypothetical protein n=1 Tax=Plantibacter flavus TaxID=150123 RepID=UPI003394AD14
MIGGRNGSGKTRVLRKTAAQLGDRGLFIDLHYLCEQAMIVLRSRDDIDDMTNEFDADGPDTDRQDDLRRIVGRRYETVEWFSLEIEPNEEPVAERFKWAGTQPLVPYFRATYKSRDFSSLEMGLGEYSMHMLFWILEQYREPGLTLLLDEPDAYLPPVGVEGLLTRLIGLCLTRGWSMVIATHSEELITHAVEERAFVLLRTDDAGQIEIQTSASDAAVGDHLLTRAPIERMIFCEDESAWYLTRALLDAHSPSLGRSTAVIWGNGEGYLGDIMKHLPKPPSPEIRFAVSPDGDQRSKFSAKGRWPAEFLPSDEDPDELFVSLGDDRGLLAERLGTDAADLDRFMDTLESEDAHDWVNLLGERYGRAHTLTCLARLWVEGHPKEAAEYVGALLKKWA